MLGFFVFCFCFLSFQQQEPTTIITYPDHVIATTTTYQKIGCGAEKRRHQTSKAYFLKKRNVLLLLHGTYCPIEFWLNVRTVVLVPNFARKRAKDWRTTIHPWHFRRFWRFYRRVLLLLFLFLLASNILFSVPTSHQWNVSLGPTDLPVARVVCSTWTGYHATFGTKG